MYLNPNWVEYSDLSSIDWMGLLGTQRQQLSQIPSLQQLISTAAGSSNEQQPHRLISSEYDDPITHHLLRYSELISNDLEEKPITEKMDHWYLDLKKNLMVSIHHHHQSFQTVSLLFTRPNSINYGYNFSKKLNKQLYVKNKRKISSHPLAFFFFLYLVKQKNTSV